MSVKGWIVKFLEWICALCSCVRVCIRVFFIRVLREIHFFASTKFLWQMLALLRTYLMHRVKRMDRFLIAGVCIITSIS